MLLRALRTLAGTLGAGAVSGLFVAGAGSRLAMGLVALADHREDFGMITSQGAQVGEITADGTEFVLFAGLLAGVPWSLAYLAIRRWLPTRAAHRRVAFAAIVVGFGLLFLVEDNEADFVFVNVAVTFIVFAAVLVGFSLVLSSLIDRFAGGRHGSSVLGPGVVVCVIALSVVATVVAVERALEIAP